MNERNHRVRFDVAMDGNSFFFEGGVNANQAPLRGTPFVVEGYIYPEDTFCQFGLLSGVNVLGDGLVLNQTTSDYLAENDLLPPVVFAPDGGPNFAYVEKEKGIVTFEVEMPGKAAHASRPYLGDNAIGRRLLQSGLRNRSNGLVEALG